VLNNFFIFANEIIFLTSIKSIISTVKTKKKSLNNRQICRFLTKKQIALTAITWCCSDLY